jgi:hypothetical protein
MAAAAAAMLGDSLNDAAGALLAIVLLATVLLLWMRTTAQAVMHLEVELSRRAVVAARDMRIAELEAEVARWRSDFLYAFTRDHLKRRYGEESRRRPIDKMRPLRDMFQERAEEIERGDFSRAAEVVDILRYYEPMVERWQRGKAAYEPAMQRIQQVEQAVEKYFATRTSATAPLPTPPGPAPALLPESS